MKRLLGVLLVAGMMFAWGCSVFGERLTPSAEDPPLSVEACTIPRETLTLESVARIRPGDPSRNFTDIWGYADHKSGTYLVFLAKQNEVAVIDVSSPQAPRVVSSIKTPFHASNHDLSVLDHYLYIVTERGAVYSTETSPGLQIVDFSNPHNPVSSFFEESFKTAHTIFIDEQARRLYAVGTDRGMRILDVSDPLHPKDIGGYQAKYIHEVYVRDGLAYAAEINDGQVEILDVRDPSEIKVVAEFRSPWSVPHSTWLSEDSRYLVIADEGHRIDREARQIFRTESGFSIYDISGVRAGEEMFEPRQVSTHFYPSATAHQIYVVGNLLFASWYTEGVKIFDIIDPAEIKELASFDTSEYLPSLKGFGGAWGLWPYDPRGEYVYVSDMEEGLVVLRVRQKEERGCEK